LDDVHKKKVSNEIRQKRRKKKLQKSSETFVASRDSITPLNEKKWTRVDSRNVFIHVFAQRKIPEVIALQSVSNHVTKTSETARFRKSDVLTSLHGAV
jgi:hypothetical protein